MAIGEREAVAPRSIIGFDKVGRIFRGAEGENIIALTDIDLDIHEGDIFGIIGLSGAGKSTLVRCINGIERPTTGHVIVEGHDIADLTGRELRELRRGIGMIFQSFNLMSSRTVRDNVLLPLVNSSLDRKSKDEKVDRLLQLVELEDCADQYPAELSGGQKQRVAIARSLANDPKILLSDEATSALDPLTTRSILRLLRRLNREMGITIVIIAHQMSVIKDVCNRVAVLDGGAIVEQGDVREVFLNPQASLTRQFISMTSSLGKADGLGSEDLDRLGLGNDALLLRLQYASRTVSEPLLSTASRRFDADINILFADVSMIGGAPLGGTVVSVSGDRDTKVRVLDYFRSRDIKVEVMSE
ncbi:MAG: ATP-binding cassette domain-containing protein [Bifidobacterium minimum]|jgi:D-methionine transport system ATP-binding protein|nr:ATP-binding cassette domain-containing protein [Bifidobacterium minimum]